MLDKSLPVIGLILKEIEKVRSESNSLITYLNNESIDLEQIYLEDTTNPVNHTVDVVTSTGQALTQIEAPTNISSVVIDNTHETLNGLGTILKQFKVTAEDTLRELLESGKEFALHIKSAGNNVIAYFQDQAGTIYNIAAAKVDYLVHLSRDMINQLPDVIQQHPEYFALFGLGIVAAYLSSKVFRSFANVITKKFRKESYTFEDMKLVLEAENKEDKRGIVSRIIKLIKDIIVSVGKAPFTIASKIIKFVSVFFKPLIKFIINAFRFAIKSAAIVAVGSVTLAGLGYVLQFILTGLGVDVSIAA